MGHRYEYEAPGFFRLTGWKLFDKVTGENTHLVWILDKHTGARHAVDHLDDAILSALADGLQKYAALPKSEGKELIDRAFYEAASALFEQRKTGLSARYAEIANWSALDWQHWCDQDLTKERRA